MADLKHREEKRLNNRRKSPRFKTQNLFQKRAKGVVKNLPSSISVVKGWGQKFIQMKKFVLGQMFF